MPSTRALLTTNHSLAGRSGSAFQVRYPNRLLSSTGSLAPSSILSTALLLGSILLQPLAACSLLLDWIPPDSLLTRAKDHFKRKKQDLIPGHLSQDGKVDSWFLSYLSTEREIYTRRRLSTLSTLTWGQALPSARELKTYHYDVPLCLL
ncbi:hypothetical protein STAS_14797 [Striga asiatica]|uniref:Uncharacterized protein n=1 Tax=Striga asiatica TaxID=4170 RepID=A0A5A7PZV7_STRAF|nr:hypothetical protein STAS_14797 [Striga asiatica]